jgi:hypothetical protein
MTMVNCSSPKRVFGSAPATSASRAARTSPAYTALASERFALLGIAVAVVAAVVAVGGGGGGVLRCCRNGSNAANGLVGAQCMLPSSNSHPLPPLLSSPLIAPSAALSAIFPGIFRNRTGQGALPVLVRFPGRRVCAKNAHDVF